MSNVEQNIRAVLNEVAACRDGRYTGRDIEPILHAVMVIMAKGPTNIPLPQLVRIVLDVRLGRKSPSGAYLSIFRGD